MANDGLPEKLLKFFVFLSFATIRHEEISKNG